MLLGEKGYTHTLLVLFLLIDIKGHKAAKRIQGNEWKGDCPADTRSWACPQYYSQIRLQWMWFRLKWLDSLSSCRDKGCPEIQLWVWWELCRPESAHLVPLLTILSSGDSNSSDQMRFKKFSLGTLPLRNLLPSSFPISYSDHHLREHHTISHLEKKRWAGPG